MFAEAPKKQLTKKELKAIEDAEFEALMGDVKVTKEEEKKSDAPVVGAGNSKNQKKKEKAKAKKEAEDKAKAEAAAKTQADQKDMTPEEMKAAAKAAMEKRTKVKNVDAQSDTANILKAEKEKRGAKKAKVHGTE
jgi:hypothetical protein